MPSGAKKKAASGPSIQIALIIYHNEFFQHKGDIIRPFLLNLRKYGDYCFLCGLDVFLDHAVVLEIIDNGRDVNELFPDKDVLLLVIVI